MARAIYCCLHHYFDILKMLSPSFCQKTVQKKFRSYFLHFYFVRWAIFILWRIPYMYYVVVVIRIKLETSWRVIKPSLSFQYDYCMTWVFIVNIKTNSPFLLRVEKVSKVADLPLNILDLRPKYKVGPGNKIKRAKKQLQNFFALFFGRRICDKIFKISKGCCLSNLYCLYVQLPLLFSLCKIPFHEAISRSLHSVAGSLLWSTFAMVFCATRD